jgi:hypothetical protein
LTTGTKDQDPRVASKGESKTSEGLVLGHAYSILECQIVGSDKILKLRNPWGTF